MISLKKIKVSNTTVYLEDLGKNEGKIILTNDMYGSHSCYWGAMGCSLSVFIQKINSEYFAGNLCGKSEIFDLKKSISNIRREIRGNLKWYNFKEEQKELREVVKSLEICESEESFVNACYLVPLKVLPYYDSNDRELIRFKATLDSIFNCEPWRFISRKPSPEYEYLLKIHAELKILLNKN